MVIKEWGEDKRQTAQQNMCTYNYTIEDNVKELSISMINLWRKWLKR